MPNSVFETRRLTVKELWIKNIQKPSEIIEITDYLSSTIYDIVNRLKKTGNVKYLPCSGHPFVLTPNKHRYLSCLLQINNAATSALIITKLNNMYLNLNMSTQTVQYILKNKLNYIVCRLQAVPLLKLNHIKAYLQ